MLKYEETQGVKVGLSFGEILEPMARSAVQSFTGLIDKFNSMSDASKKSLIAITALGMGTGIFLRILGGSFKGVQKMILGTLKLQEGFGKLATKLGMTSKALLGTTAGIAALAAGFIYVMTYEERANKKLQEYNKTLAENQKVSAENIKQHTSDIEQAKASMQEIEALEEKLSKTTNKDERLQIEGEILNKKKALIDIMPEVAEGMSAETTSQQELNKALQEYIDKKNEEIAMEKRSQINNARDYFSKDENKQVDVTGTISAEKNSKFLQEQLDLLADYDEKTKINGKEVGSIRKNLENQLSQNEKRFEENKQEMEQFLDMYEILESSGKTIPKNLRDQKALIDEYMKGDYEKNHGAVNDTVSQAFRESFGDITKGAKSSQEAVNNMNKAIDDVIKNIPNIGENAVKGLERFRKMVNDGNLTVEEFERAIGNFEKTATKDFGLFQQSATDALDSIMTKFGDNELSFEEFERATATLDKYSSEKFKNIGGTVEEMLRKMAIDFNNGELPIDNFEQAVNAMTLYAEQDFSKLDEKSQEVINKLMQKLPEGGQAVKDFELAINGMSIKSSLDMNNFDSVTQTAINNVISKFNDNKMTAQEFSDTMNLMSLLSSEAMAKLDESQRTALNNLIGNFNNNKITASQFADGVMSSLGIAGTKISSFSQEGQTQLLGIIGQFLSGKISSDDLKASIDSLKNNPEFFSGVKDGMDKAGGAAQSASGNLSGFNKEWAGTPNGQVKTNTVELHKKTIETTIQKSGKQGGSGDYSDKHAGKKSRFSMPIGVEKSSSRSINIAQATNDSEQQKVTSPLTRENKTAILSSNSRVSNNQNTSISSYHTSENKNLYEDDIKNYKKYQNSRVKLEEDANNKIARSRMSLSESVDDFIKKEHIVLKRSLEAEILQLEREKEVLQGTRVSNLNSEIANKQKELSELQKKSDERSKEEVKRLQEDIKKLQNDLEIAKKDDIINALQAEKDRIEKAEQGSLSAIENIRDKAYQAMRNKLEKQKNEEFKIYDEQMEKIKKLYDDEKKKVNEVYDAKIEALRKEKDILNGETQEDYQGKVDELKAERDKWLGNDSAYAKQKLKELEEKIKEAEKELANKIIDDEIDALEKRKQEEEKLLEDDLNAKTEAMEKEREEREKFWEEQLSDQNMYGKVNNMIIAGQFGELLDMITEYAPDYAHLGELFGQSFAEKFKLEVQDAIEALKFMKGEVTGFNQHEDWWKKSNQDKNISDFINSTTNKSTSSSNTNTNQNTEEEKKGKGKVTTGTLNVREGAGTNYKVVGSVYKGEEVQILDENNGWYKIEYWSTKYKKNRQGWSSSAYIQKFHTGGIIGRMANDEGIAMVQTGERILSREQTNSFEKLVDLLPNMSSLAKFSNLKGNTTNNELTFNNTFNIQGTKKISEKELSMNITKKMEQMLSRKGLGSKLRPVTKF